MFSWLNCKLAVIVSVCYIYSRVCSYRLEISVRMTSCCKLTSLNFVKVLIQIFDTFMIIFCDVKITI